MSHSYIAKVLKIMVVIMALLGLGMYGYVIPAIGNHLYENGTLPAQQLVSLWTLLYDTTAIPCYFVLIKVWMVAKNFEMDKIFYKENVKHFNHIYTATLFDIVYFAVLGIGFYIGNFDRDIYMVIIKCIICFIGFAFGFVVKVIGAMIEKAAELKEENDLTI